MMTKCLQEKALSEGSCLKSVTWSFDPVVASSTAWNFVQEVCDQNSSIEYLKMVSVFLNRDSRNELRSYKNEAKPDLNLILFEPTDDYELSEELDQNDLAARDLAYAGQLFRERGDTVKADQLELASKKVHQPQKNPAESGNGIGSTILTGAISALQTLGPLALRALSPF